MQRVILLVSFLFLCIFNLNVWGMNEPEEDDVTRVTRLLRDVETNVNENYEQGTIYLGNTDSGKSTLFNSLQGAPLHGRFARLGRYDIIFAPGVNAVGYSPIGLQRTVSQTTLPVVINNNFDSPGFKDTRPLQDIVNAYSIYRIVKQTRNLKIVLVSSVEEITGPRSIHFLDFIDQLGNIFQHNIEALCNGLCLVMTKVNRHQVDKNEYKAIFGRIVDEQLNARVAPESPRIKILRFLSRTDRIGFFKMPEANGLIPNDDKEAIKAMISSIPYQANIRPVLSLVDARSKLAINGLIGGILGKMRDIIADFNGRYPELYKNFLESNLNTDNNNTDKKASKLRERLKVVTQHLENVSTEPGRFYESTEKMGGILGLLSHGNREAFNTNRGKLAFFKHVGLGEEIESKVREYNIFNSLEGFRKDAGEYIAIEQVEKKIAGFLLGVSDINKMLRGRTISEVEVYSLNTLLIDEDFTQPGINLTLMAPHWWVIENKTISLKGSDGLAHDVAKARDGNADYPDGEHGLPGNPGESSGYFYGKGKVFRGLENLTIDVRGGKGGPGQDGGNGINGQDGRSGNKTEVENRKKERFQQSTSSKAIKYALPLITCGNSGTFEKYQSGEPGKVGGDGGKGGVGGEGGKTGTIKFEGNENNPIQLSESENEVIKPGKGGAVGKGGKHKPLYAGTYIDIKMFGAHKHIIKEIIKNTVGAEEERKYGFFGKLAKKIFGCGGCIDLTQYGIKGVVIVTEVGFEVLKGYAFYQLGGPYLLSAELFLTTAHLGFDSWYIKPHKQNLGIEALPGSEPTSLNATDLRHSLPKESINIIEKNTYYQWLFEKYRRNKLVIS